MSVLAHLRRVRSRLLTTQLEALRAAEQRKRLLAERTRAAEPGLRQQGEPEEERWRIARGDPYVDRAPCSTTSQLVASRPSGLLITTFCCLSVITCTCPASQRFTPC